MSRNRNVICDLLTAIILLSIGSIACKQSPANNSPSTPSTTPAPVTRSLPDDEYKPIAINVPQLVGKSPAEVQKMLGKPLSIDKLNTTDETGDLSYDYKFGEGACFINFKKGKFNYIHFTSKTAFPTFFPLGDLVGVNLRGVIPTTSNAAQVSYLNSEINGIKFKQVTVNSDGRYDIITFRLE